MLINNNKKYNNLKIKLKLKNENKLVNFEIVIKIKKDFLKS